MWIKWRQKPGDVDPVDVGQEYTGLYGPSEKHQISESVSPSFEYAQPPGHPGFSVNNLK